MEIFESNMRKTFYKKTGKLKEYSIKSLGVNSPINEDIFEETDDGRLVCDVLICFPDEYAEFQNEHEEFQSKIQSLEKTISDHEETIKKLENQLSNIEEDYQKEMKDLKEKYSGKVDGLKADLHDKDLEIEKMKTKYAEEIGDIKADHQKELNRMRGNCLKLRVRENKGYSSYIEELDSLGKIDKLFNRDKAIIKKMRRYNVEAIDEEAIDVQFNLIDGNNGRADE